MAGFFGIFGGVGTYNPQSTDHGDGGARSRIDDLIDNDSPLEMTAHVPSEDVRRRARKNWEVTEKTRLGGTGLYASKFKK